MRKWILTVTLLLSGCEMTSRSAQQDAINAMHTDLRRLQNSVTLSNKQIAALKASESETDGAIGEQIVSLNSAIGELDATVRNMCQPQTDAVDARCEDIPRPVILDANDGKMVLGEVEKVWVDPPGLSMIARIDTGASSSSMHADNITPFERDGDDWVRFDIGDAEETITLERPVTKFVRVFQQADKSGARRPVVEMRLVLGDIEETFAMTLADRSHLDHDMILGRNFLTDTALVDVSQQFVQPAYSPAEQ